MKQSILVIANLLLCLVCFSQDFEDVDKTLDSITSIGLSNPEKTASLFQEAKRLISDKNSEKYYEVLLLQVKYYSAIGDHDNILRTVDSLINQNLNSEYKTEGYIKKAIVFAQQNKSEAALKNLRLALPIAKSENSIQKLSEIFKIMGNIAFNGGNGPEAIEQYRKAAEYSNKDQNKIATGLIYNNIVRAFEMTDMLDSAMHYNKKILKIVEETNNSGELYFSANLNEADFQNKLGNHDIAKTYITNALETAKKIGNPFMIGSAHQVNSVVYGGAKDYDKAIAEAKKAIDIFNSIGAKNFTMQTSFLLRDYQALSGDYESAFKTGEYYRKQLDSLNALESDKSLKELRIQYETAEQKLKIAEQNANLYKKDQQQKLFLITIIALLIVSILGFLYYKQRQRTQLQKIANLENEKENVALRSLITGEEKERSRIAKELHDGLGGILAAAKMHANNKENLPKVIELIDSASKESRRISHNLLPESLIKKGLDATLKDYTDSLNDSGLIKVDYQAINLNSKLSSSLQLSVYRIIQELLSNTIKHAEATEVLVQLQERNSQLMITVEDNGKGFNDQSSRNGIGLSNIESRLSLLKGKLKIDSDQKMGTSVYIELQLDKQ